MAAVQVILNPNAAGGRGGRVRRRVEAALVERGHEYLVHATSGPGHARILARELAQGKEKGPILVVGGDGTIHEVANGLLEARDSPGFPLAILPVGTGNDFHRMVRCSGKIHEVLTLLDRGVPRPFDVGVVRWEGGASHFVNLLGVGVDVEVLRRRARFRRLSGLPQYLAALLSALVRFSPVELELELEGAGGHREMLRKPVLLSAVTVGPTIGGGFRLSPGARPDDGLLDLFLVEPLGVLEVARYLPQVLRGTHRNGGRIHLRTLRSARIASQDRRPFAFELDGELAPEETPWLELELLPGALSILDHPPAPGKDAPAAEESATG